jgi:hypothetical protein
VQPAAGDVVPAADPATLDGVPHLASPDNLPPGTTTAPVAPNQPRLSYLRDLLHAMRTQEVSGSDALLLLTQRPMTSSPQTGQPVGPQAPVPVVPPPADAPPVAP